MILKTLERIIKLLPAAIMKHPFVYIGTLILFSWGIMEFK